MKAVVLAVIAALATPAGAAEQGQLDASPAVFSVTTQPCVSLLSLMGMEVPVILVSIAHHSMEG